MKKLVIAFVLAVTAISASAQLDKLKADKDAILSMCGCYKVEFRYAEVYSPDTGYKFHDREYTWAYEWVNAVENTDKRVALQHLLVVDTGVVKHWRQDWLFENTSAHLFDKNYKWNFKQWNSKDVKGQWTQKVYQVDDSPRYTATGTWMHTDGKHIWETTADSPLPRRELTSRRSDYNVLVRGNRHEITSYGWMHRQDNQKVLRADGKDKLIAVETGYNTYTRVNESECAQAKVAWEKYGAFWTMVRKSWEKKEALGTDITVKVMVDGKMLYEKMFDLAERSAAMDSKKVQAEIDAIITAHTVIPVSSQDTGLNQ